MSINRFSAALMSIDNPNPPLVVLATNLYAAIVEAEAYGKNPATDAAVLLLNMQISFITNVDQAIETTFDSLVQTCQLNALRPNIDPMKVN
jgi:hypothetical protein